MGIEDMIDEVVSEKKKEIEDKFDEISVINMVDFNCLLYTSPSPRDCS